MIIKQIYCRFCLFFWLLILLCFLDVNGCWIKLKLKETRGDSRCPGCACKRENCNSRWQTKIFVSFANLSRVREGEKYPRNIKIKKKCECVECTTAAYGGCLCCYLLHQQKCGRTSKKIVAHTRRERERGEIYKFLPILNAIFVIYFLYLSRRRWKKGNFPLSCCVINNDAKPAWLNWKSNGCVRDSWSRHHTREPTTIVNFLFMYTEHTYHKFHADAIHLPPTRLSLSPLHQCPFREYTKVFAKNSTWCTKIEKVFDEVYALFTHCWVVHAHIHAAIIVIVVRVSLYGASEGEKGKKEFMVEEKSQKI